MLKHSTHACMCTCTHTHMCTYALSLSLSLTHTNMHADTPAQSIGIAYKHTHTHTHLSHLELNTIDHCPVIHRAQFDIVSQSCEPTLQHPPQVFINCNFCGKSITSNRGGSHITSRFMQFNPFSSRPPQQQRQKVNLDSMLADLQWGPDRR